MIQKLKILLASLGVLFVLPLAAAAPALAATTQTDINDSECNGSQLSLTASGGCSAIQDSGSSVDTIIKNVVNVLSVVVGIVAVIMIIVGGFRYITSAGNPEGAKSARNTILYAIIGLVIVALAQIIVHFVLTKATNVGA
jgi:cytochrome bd-type quinol oxidase subunit 2